MIDSYGPGRLFVQNESNGPCDFVELGFTAELRQTIFLKIAQSEQCSSSCHVQKWVDRFVALSRDQSTAR